MNEKGSFRRKAKIRKSASKRSSRLLARKKKQKKLSEFVKREADKLNKQQRKLTLLKLISETPECLPESSQSEEKHIINEADENVEVLMRSETSNEESDNVETNECTTRLSVKGEGQQLYDGCFLYPIDNRILAGILALSSDCECVKFHGQAKMTTIKGCCTVNGFKMCPGRSYNVFSPISNPAMVLTPLEDKTDDDVNILLTSLNINVDDPSIKEKLIMHDVLILWQPISEDISWCSFPKYRGLYTVGDSHVPQQLCDGCWAVSTDNYFHEHRCYKSAVKALSTVDVQRSANEHSICKFPIVLTAGLKSSGKSTFNRYTVNRLLDRFSKVYYLDCDVGQAEFTTSGFISLHTVTADNPPLGPPFTHLCIPKYSCFFGNKTASGNPDFYIECVKFVLDSFLKDLHQTLDAPLVVNVMGWMQSVGTQLLVDLIRMICPTHIMQFSSRIHIKRLNPSVVHTADGWVTTPGPNQQTYHFMLLDPEPVALKKRMLQNTNTFSPKDHRDLALLYYLTSLARSCALSQSIDFTGKVHDDIRAVKPYCVKLSELAVCDATETPTKYKYVMAVLNASVVGLCVLPKESARSLLNPPADSFLHPPSPCPCLGLGVVRGVDVEAGVLYIVSDVPPSELERVNCLVSGHLVLLDSFFNTIGKDRNHILPYVTKNYAYTTIGARVFKVYRQFPLNKN